MKSSRLWGIGALLFFVTGESAVTAQQHPMQPVALVYSLVGEANITHREERRQPLRLFDRLPAGASLEVGVSSRLALAFKSGLRYELGERSRVTVGPKDLASRLGPVRPLPRVPPLLLPIEPKDRPGLRVGALRIRGERITGLYPRRGAAALAGAIVLGFRPVAGARSYQIEVQDRQGRIVFRADTEAPPVKVPAGTLRAANYYRWTVRTLDRPGATARGEAKLVILSEKAAQAREETRKILATEGPGSLPLLAEIDCSLGLWLEAREDLRAALDAKPGDPALRKALAEIEARLEHENDRD